MQFKHLLTSVTFSLALVPDLGSAMIYRAFSDSNSCARDRPHFWTEDNGWVCTRIPDPYGFSADFENLPNFSKGQGYADTGCSAFEFDQVGPGYRCWRGTGRRIKSMNWFTTARIAQPAKVGEQECVEPAGFAYKDAEGVMRNIKVPTVVNASDKIAQLYEDKDFEALAAYESV